jgi:hypothetical protein
MSAPIEQLLSRLDGVKRSRKNGWMSRCPAHNGDGRSLAVTHADDGRILIHCFAHQCEAGDILAAVGMSTSDLFPEPLNRDHQPMQPMRHGVTALDVVRVLRSEANVLAVIASDCFAQGTDPDLCRRAALAADRITTALALCDG